MSTSKDPRDEMWELRVKEKKDQLATELIRYKQDCRKRAMDMAHQRAMQIGNGVEIDLKKAQEYYEWLTKDLN